jgi:hemerythrin-like metal-binding protein
MVHLLPWSEGFAVGHEGLDAEHHHLVELINKVDAVVRTRKNPEQFVDLLKVLQRVAMEHIRHENSILLQIQTGNYEPLKKQSQTQHFLKAMAKAAFDEHTEEHDAILDRLTTIVAGPVSTLCDELRAWFVDHVQHESDLKAILQVAA